MTVTILGFVVFVLGAAADIYTSKRGLEDPSLHLKEGKAVGAYFYRVMGWYGFVVEKALALGVCCLIGGVLGWEGVGGGMIGAGALFLFQAYRNRKLIQSQRAAL